MTLAAEVSGGGPGTHQGPGWSEDRLYPSLSGRTQARPFGFSCVFGTLSPGSPPPAPPQGVLLLGTSVIKVTLVSFVIDIPLQGKNLPQRLQDLLLEMLNLIQKEL